MISKNHEFESLAKVGFVFETELRDINGKLLSRDVTRNLYPMQGINALLNIGIGTQDKLAGFYIGIFEGDYTPLQTDTAQNIATNATECTAYVETARPAWVSAPATAGVITNFASPAQFTFNATKTVFGAFITSGLGKAGTVGSLISVARFAASQTGAAGNVLTVKAGCTLANA